MWVYLLIAVLTFVYLYVDLNFDTGGDFDVNDALRIIGLSLAWPFLAASIVVDYFRKN